MQAYISIVSQNTKESFESNWINDQGAKKSLYAEA